MKQFFHVLSPVFSGSDLLTTIPHAKMPGALKAILRSPMAREQTGVPTSLEPSNLKIWQDYFFYIEWGPGCKDV